jgi:hypothetical protein
MGLRPTQGDEKRLLSSNRSPWKRRPPLLSSRAHPDFLLRGTKDDLVCGFHQGKPHELRGTHRTQQEIRGSRGICSSADLSWKCFSTERTRISCCAAVERAACAAFRKESRMKLANATKPDRKSGGSAVEGPAVSFSQRADAP